MLLVYLIFFLFFSNSALNISGSFNFENNACTHLYDYPIKFFSKNCYFNPSVKSSTPSMIERNGYKLQTYKITTSDGYILTLFRIPVKPDDNRKNKQPVYLHHGVFVDSGSWTLIGNRSLAFNLADLGYDVWLGNERGTRYSRTHRILQDSDPKFWDYNLDDLIGDIKVSLEAVAEATRKNGLIIYIGHSRGTSLLFMLGSQFPGETQKLLVGAVALSPIVYFDARPDINLLFTILPSVSKILLDFNVTSIFYHMKHITSFLEIFCTFFPYICRLGIDISSGRTELFLSDDLLNFYSHFPDTLSVSLALQYAQMHNSGKFQKFDYGKKKNLVKYGQENPPLYNLSQFKIPIYMYYGKHDSLITEKSVTEVYNQLGSARKHFETVPFNNSDDWYQFGHNDFYFSKTLREFYYTTLFKTLEEF